MPRSDYNQARDRFLDDHSFEASPMDNSLRLRLTQILNSKGYFYFTLLLLGCTLFLFLWLIISKFQPENIIFIVLDGFVCISFAADVIMRVYIATPSAYFDCGRPKNWREKLNVIWNWFDFSVVWLSGLSFCLFLVSNKNSEETTMDATVEITLICFRAITSVLRFYGVLKATGLSFKRMGQDTYRNLNDDSFSMNELIERGAGQSILEDDDSGLDEDDLFARPATNPTTSANHSNIKKQEIKAQETKNKGIFGSFTGAFGLNDSDDDDDEDGSGLDEEDLFKRPEMIEITTPTIGNNIINSTMTEDDLFQSCIQDPTYEVKKNKLD